jgi:hypothetical protein
MRGRLRLGRRRTLDLQPLQRLDLKDTMHALTANTCSDCTYASHRATETGDVVVCTCNTEHRPLALRVADTRPARTFRFDAARDIPLLVRWLPELLARSPALARATGSPGHNGSGASAHGGRLDHIDESRAYSRAVETCRYLRACVAADQGASVATLWTAYALVPEFDDARRQHAARCEALAFGAAPKVLRAQWRERVAERDRFSLVKAPLSLTMGFEAVDGRSAALHREVTRTSAAILSTKGPSFDAQATRWGAEHLAVLWAPAGVPEAIANAVAMGFASAAERSSWDGMRRGLRESSMRSWAERLLDSVADRLLIARE